MIDEGLLNKLLSGYRPSVREASIKILDGIKNDIESSLIKLLMEIMSSYVLDNLT